MAKILILDIETSPALGYVWRLFKQNVALNQLQKETSVLSWAAKWLGEDKIFYYDTFIQSEEYIIGKLKELLDEADCVVTHNGNRFDLPRIRSACVIYGMSPPAPFKSIDTCAIAKKEFGFDSNKLEFIAKILKCTPKMKRPKFPGFELWSECLKGNPEAWKEMKEYNIQDIETLEEVYLKLRPWIINHPNLAVLKEGNEISCPKCGSEHLQRRGFYHTNTQKYQRYQCQGCGGWHRTRYTEYPKDKRKNILVNTA